MSRAVAIEKYRAKETYRIAGDSEITETFELLNLERI